MPINTKRTCSNLHLPYDVDRLAAVERNGQAGLFPCVKAAVENICLAVCRGGKTCGVSARARARPAMKYEYFIAGARRTFGIHPAQRMMSCAGDAFTRMLVGLADVDEDRTSAHEFGGALREKLFAGQSRSFSFLLWLALHGQ